MIRATTNNAPNEPAQPGATSAAGTDLFVARQPIFDVQRRVVGYELLFRSSHDNHCHFDDSNQATRQTVNTSLNVVGLRRLVGEVPAWVNLTRDLLVEEFYRVLPVDQTVVEVLEDIQPDPEVIEACRRLKAAGYRLALDDFVFAGNEHYDPLIALADVIKVDLAQAPARESADYLRRHARRGLTFLAEKVEEHHQFQESRQYGFKLFQGYFFSKPEILQDRTMAACRQNYLMILQEVTKPALDLQRLERMIKLEPSLAFKLLRYINSAGTGVRYRVTSIRHAMNLIGDQAMRRWGALVVITCLGEDKPVEAVRLCLQRARFCECLGPQMKGSAGQADHFFLGMLSGLDGLMDQPLGNLLAALPIDESIRAALLGDESPLAKLYLMCLACERGRWSQATLLAKVLGLDPGNLARAHRQAMAWADQALAGDVGHREPASNA